VADSSSGDETGSKSRRWLSHPLVIALIGAAAAILAAEIAAHAGGIDIVSGSAPSARTTVTITPSPRPTVTVTVTASPVSNGISLSPNRVPIVTPMNDSGFTPVWHGLLTVGAAGVRITSSGVHPGTPQDLDLGYQPGGDMAGWQLSGTNSDVGQLWPWKGTGTPDPAFCSREYLNAENGPGGLPNIGDKYCYADHNGVVGYMQVTNIGQNDVSIATWLWKKLSS
jgi:hypothetical protein